MKEPRKLIDAGSDEFMKGLLRSARHDEASAAAVARAAAALGVGAAVGAGSSAASAAAAAGTGAASNAPAGAVASTAGTLAMIKAIGLGVIAGLLTVGVAEYAFHPTPAHEAPRGADAPAVDAPPAAALARTDTARPSEPTPGTAASRPARSPMPAAPVVIASQAPPSPRAPPALRESAGAVPEPSSSASPLAREIGEVDRARRALSSGDASEALRLLDIYERAGRTGVLDPEAAIVRVEALLRSGRRREAAMVAHRFMAANPSSPHARRLAELAAEAR